MEGVSSSMLVNKMSFSSEANLFRIVLEVRRHKFKVKLASMELQVQFIIAPQILYISKAGSLSPKMT